MNKMIHPSYSNTVLDEAANWMARLSNDMADTNTKDAFNRWLESAPDHKAAFEDMESLSRDTADISHQVKYGKGPSTEAFDAALAECQEMMSDHRRSQEKAQNPAIMPRLMAIAASLLLMVSGYWAWKEGYNPFAGPDIYQTAVGEQRIIKLADGSTITLNTASELRASLSPRTRTLELASGEAYFDVAKDESRPFIVNVQESTVQAVGTAFNIRQRAGNIRVTVTDGKVKVSPDSEKSSGQSNLLSAGEQISYGAGETLITELETTAIKRETLWRQGKIILDGKRLAAIAEEIQPYIPEKIIIEDEDISALTAGGVFKIGHVDSLFSALEVALPVQISRKDGAIIMSRRAS